jgi:NAD(P)-dependent dehydrogenase (short-subunit alcohol dehydrogenase family)
MSGRLTGKVAFITGAARGQGRAREGAPRWADLSSTGDPCTEVAHSHDADERSVSPWHTPYR